MIGTSLVAALLIIVGVLMLALEVKTFLGHGFAGLFGVALAAWGVWLAMETGDGLSVVAIVGISVVVAVLGSVALVRSGKLQRLVHTGAIVGHPSDLAETGGSLVGQSGIALTDLRPSGSARIGGKKFDVVAADGAYLVAQTPIEVVRINQNSVIVRKAGT